MALEPANLPRSTVLYAYRNATILRSLLEAAGLAESCRGVRVRTRAIYTSLFLLFRSLALIYTFFYSAYRFDRIVDSSVQAVRGMNDCEMQFEKLQDAAYAWGSCRAGKTSQNSS